MAWMEFEKVKSYEHKSKEGERALLSQLEKARNYLKATYVPWFNVIVLRKLRLILTELL